MAGRGFDVTTDVPFRVGLYRLAPDTYVLAMVLHHIASDGSSFGPFARDVVTAYSARAEGHEPQWAPLSIQYADYAVWQREALGLESDPESAAAQQIAYWTEELDGLPDQLDLPSDRPRPAVASYGGSKHRFDIDAETHRRLVDLARTHHASLFMVVHAAYAVLLSRLSGSSDIAIGTAVAGRGEKELDDLIGMFVNTLVLRSRIDPGSSFTEFLGDVRGTDLTAFSNADVPFERLVEVLNPTRSTARHPLFQAALSLEPAHARDVSFAGVHAVGTELDMPISKFDIQLWVTERLDRDGHPAGLGAIFEFATDLFDEATVASFGERFVRILDGVVTDPTTPVATSRSCLPVRSIASSRLMIPESPITRLLSPSSSRVAAATPTASQCATATRRSPTASSTRCRTASPATSRVSVQVPKRLWRWHSRAPGKWSSASGRWPRPVRRTCRSTPSTRPNASPTCSTIQVR